MKESNPVEVVEYAEARGIKSESAFAWWALFTLRKRGAVISVVNLRVRKTTHKYGIEIPTSVEHAKEIDRRNKHRAWQDAIEPEMKNVGVAFKILESGEHVSPEYAKSSGHLVFNVRMNFQC